MTSFFPADLTPGFKIRGSVPPRIASAIEKSVTGAGKLIGGTAVAIGGIALGTAVTIGKEVGGFTLSGAKFGLITGAGAALGAGRGTVRLFRPSGPLVQKGGKFLKDTGIPLVTGRGFDFTLQRGSSRSGPVGKIEGLEQLDPGVATFDPPPSPIAGDTLIIRDLAVAVARARSGAGGGCNCNLPRAQMSPLCRRMCASGKR